jgi:toxin YoeB
MEVVYTLKAQKDIEYWKKSGKKNIQQKITSLIQSIGKNPSKGIGKPELLKHDLLGCWSRRIDAEHRIVYEALEDKIVIHSLRGHY